ncbi:nervous fingers 1 [Cochliomyia hominivorax]
MAAVTQHNLQMLNNATYTHSIGGMPHGLGLLTTVASLPPKYRSRYLNIKTKCEIPLDLSRKSMSPQLECEVPMAANFTEVYTEPCSDTASQASDEIIEELVQQCQLLNDNNTNEITKTSEASKTSIQKQEQPQPQRQRQENQREIIQHHKPITPPLTPTKKRKFSETSSEAETEAKENVRKLQKIDNNKLKTQPLVENTPAKPIKNSDTAPKTHKNISSNPKTNRSNKATRKLKFDEETSSPVSGTIIRPLEDITDGTVQYSNGDIDPKYNIVEITEETKAELAAIKNVIGDYVCKLCRIKFDDAFGLAQHRCACIVLLEYRCPECGKQFNCPANLASHRRWHKPRKDGSVASIATASSSANNKKENKEQKPNKKSEDSSDTIYNCQECGKKFKRQAYLKKHQLTHQQKSSENNAEKSVITTEETQISSASSSTTSSPIQQQQQQQITTIVHNTTIIHSPPPSTEMQYVQNIQHHHHQPTTYDDQDDTMSDYSSTSSNHGYGRLQIIETGLTEEENIAAAALTNLRNCASVIQHTTLAH